MSYLTEERVGQRGPTWLLAAATVVLLAAGPAFGQDEGEEPVSGDERQTIITNQFTSASGGAIAVRRPGLWVQQGLAVNTGNLEIPGDAEDEPPNFFRDTFDQIAMDLLDFISGLLEGVNFFISSLTGAGGSSGSGDAIFIPITNAATTGQGTTVNIP